MTFSNKTIKETAKKLNIDFNVIPLKQFIMGMKVELEHKDVTKSNPIKTAKIALAHLKEDKNYYTKLKTIEKGFKMEYYIDNKNYIIEKAFGHKNVSKLQKKTITNKSGKKQTVYVNKSPNTGFKTKNKK